MERTRIRPSYQSTNHDRQGSSPAFPKGLPLFGDAVKLFLTVRVYKYEISCVDLINFPSSLKLTIYFWHHVFSASPKVCSSFNCVLCRRSSIWASLLRRHRYIHNLMR